MVNRSVQGRRSYEHRLRVVGAQLDEGGFHAVTIIEAEDGLLVRASSPGSRRPEVLEIPEIDLAKVASFSRRKDPVPHRLFPGGYEVFLAALGERLDRSRAEAISIVEGTDFITVGGIQPVAAEGDSITYEPLDILLLADDIRLILSSALETAPPEPAADCPPADDPADPRHQSSPIAPAVDPGSRMVPSEYQAARVRG